MAVVWVTATVLQLLAAQGLSKAGASFTSTELNRWVQGKLSRTQRMQATGLMGRAGFWTLEQTSATERCYTLTAEGAAAVAEAGHGKVHRSGPNGPSGPKTPSPDSLVVRLWKLLRLRGALDADSAARTLCDAGDADAFERARANIGKYLVLWKKAGAVDVAARRVGAAGQSRGFKRYVLKDEWKGSALPPPWYQIAKAKAQEVAQ